MYSGGWVKCGWGTRGGVQSWGGLCSWRWVMIILGLGISDKLVLKLVQGFGQKAVSVRLTSGVRFRVRDGLGFS